MKHALVKNGVVDNVAVGGTPEWIAIMKTIYDSVVELEDTADVNISDLYDGHVFTTVEPVPTEE